MKGGKDGIGRNRGIEKRRNGKGWEGGYGRDREGKRKEKEERE